MEDVCESRGKRRRKRKRERERERGRGENSTSVRPETPSKGICEKRFAACV